jgi:hypothetical protein
MFVWLQFIEISSSGLFLFRIGIHYEGDGLQHGEQSKEGDSSPKKQIYEEFIYITITTCQYI